MLLKKNKIHLQDEIGLACPPFSFLIQWHISGDISLNFKIFWMLKKEGWMDSNEKHGCLVDITKSRLKDQSMGNRQTGIELCQAIWCHLQSQHMGGRGRITVCLSPDWVIHWDPLSAKTMQRERERKEGGKKEEGKERQRKGVKTEGQMIEGYRLKGDWLTYIRCSKPTLSLSVQSYHFS